MAALPSVLSPRAAEAEEPVREVHEDKESDGRSWLSRMAGRRLGVPFRGRKVPSLAEWLAERSASREHAAALPGALAQEDELQGVLPAHHGLRRESVTERVPSAPSSARAAVRARSKSRERAPEEPIMLLGAAAGARRRRGERRLMHPTVRGGMKVEAAAALWETESDEDVAASESRIGTFGEQPQVPGLPSIASGGRVGVRRGPQQWGGPGPPRRGAQPGGGGGGGGSSASSSGADDKNKALILPRVPAQRKPQSGSVATMHASADSTIKVLTRYGSLSPRSETSSASGGEDPVDRKWHIRQASLSAAMASKKRDKPQKRAQSEGSLAISGQPDREYLSFEGWGLDDDYVCTLLQRTVLSRMRFINMSENRLTEATVTLLVNKGREQSLSALESLHFRSNRLGPASGRALALLLAETKPPLLQLDLSDNAMGDQACEELCEALTIRCPSLVGLCLARTDIGHSGRAGSAIGMFVGTAKHLQALDLHWNWLHGPGAAALLQGMQDNAQQPAARLWRVNLAWNRLGHRGNESQPQSNAKSTTGKGADAVPKAVTILASIFCESKALFHLDLSYNSLRSADCAVLAEGLKNNHTLYGLHLTGNEGTIDDAGFIVPSGGSDNAEALQEAIGREGLRGNLNESVRHTPLRLRLDRLGYFNGRDHLGPAPEKAREMSIATLRANPSLARLANNDAFSSQDLAAEKEWVDVHAKVQRLGDYNQHFEDARLNEHCCWICENWVQEEVSYIPGWSGSETAMDETTEVFAYFSIDGFLRPTRLAKASERYFDRHFGLKSAHELAGAGTAAALQAGNAAMGVRYVHEVEGGKSRKPLVDAQGKYVVFKGARMLPPSSLPIRVVFQVNQTLVCADHMAKVALASPTTIALHCDGRGENSSGALPALAVALEQTVEVSEANVICVGSAAWQRFEQGMAYALCLMEDPRHRGDLELVPRRLQHGRSAKAREQPWSFERSSFRDYRRESAELYGQCFDEDFAASKLERYLADHAKDEGGIRTVRANYKSLVAAFHSRALKGFAGQRCSAGLAVTGFEEFLSSGTEYKEPRSEEGPPRRASAPGERPARPALNKFKTVADLARKTSRRNRFAARLLGNKAGEQPPEFIGQVFCPAFPPSAADTIFVSAAAADKHNAATKEMIALPPQGLARFQFLEAFVKVAVVRFVHNGEQDTAENASAKLLYTLNPGEEHLEGRSTLQAALFCEECCTIVRNNRRILHEAFAAYSRRLRFPGESSNDSMTFNAWVDFLQACNAQDFGAPPHLWGTAFALGREVRADEYRSFRHMELSWSEFLVCIGAVVQLSEGFGDDPYPDRLLEFVEVHVTQAFQKMGPTPSRYTMDPHLSKLVTLVGQVFEEADVDKSGFLSQQEFNTVLRRKDIIVAFREVGMSIDDFKVLFAKVDAGGSNAVPLDDLCNGLVRMKKSMLGQERTLAYIRRAFEEADGSDIGIVAKEDFNAVIAKPQVHTKLMMMGVPADDIDDLAAAVDAQDTDGRPGVTAEDVVACFLALREESSAKARGLNFVRQVCKGALGDLGHMLTRSDFKTIMHTERVEQKIEKLGLPLPDWMDVFDALDVDSDRQLSWEEIKDGIGAIWTEAEAE